MTLKADLIAARKLIEREEDWGQGGVSGFPPCGKLCAGMALSASLNGAPNERRVAAHHALFAQVTVVAGRTLTEFNDNHTHAEVLQLFDRAIEAAP